MAQLFPRKINTIAKLSIIMGLGLVTGILVLGGILTRGPYYTQVGIAREQKVPFSHKHHVGGVGIDCRFCHTSVEKGAFAGIPPTTTCMKCHSQIFADAPMLEPVRESFRTGKPMEWTKVHDLPDYVYFDHSIHVKKGVSCVTCHGQVDKMPLMMKKNTLHMEWCLSCHRNPEKFVGLREHVADPHWKNTEDQKTLGTRLVKEYKIKKLTDCSVCHR
jgi:ferredoxin